MYTEEQNYSINFMDSFTKETMQVCKTLSLGSLKGKINKQLNNFCLLKHLPYYIIHLKTFSNYSDYLVLETRIRMIFLCIFKYYAPKLSAIKNVFSLKNTKVALRQPNISLQCQNCSFLQSMINLTCENRHCLLTVFTSVSNKRILNINIFLKSFPCS